MAHDLSSRPMLEWQLSQCHLRSEPDGLVLRLVLATGEVGVAVVDGVGIVGAPRLGMNGTGISIVGAPEFGMNGAGALKVVVVGAGAGVGMLAPAAARFF